MKLLKLKIDPEFKALIPKLRKNEYLQLESNIMMDGCREAIITWNGIIVDGHNRYEICHRHNIPFHIKEMEFDCREAVISWICANQLGRRNISEETRKYLIGLQYHTEKIATSKRNERGVNQFTITDKPSGVVAELSQEDLSHRTAQRLADEHHLSHCTVQKYAQYSRALDEISQHEPKLAAKILSGHYKISHRNVVELSKLTPEEMRRINRRIDTDSTSTPFIQYKRTRTVINNGKRELEQSPESQGPTIKDMPEFDPDAEITSLTLTIPSWTSSIERTQSKANLSIVSSGARRKLKTALRNLQDMVEEMLEAIKEDQQ